MPSTAEHDAPESYVVTYRNKNWNASHNNESMEISGLTQTIVLNLTGQNRNVIYKVWVSAKSSTGEGLISKVLTLRYESRFHKLYVYKALIALINYSNKLNS